MNDITEPVSCAHLNLLITAGETVAFLSSSTYIIFGDIELYVPIHLKDIAKQLLNQGLAK